MYIKNYYCPTCHKFKNGFQVECIGEDNIGCWLICKKCKQEILFVKNMLKEYIEKLEEK